jgi:hypothetical protein
MVEYNKAQTCSVEDAFSVLMKKILKETPFNEKMEWIN